MYLAKENSATAENSDAVIPNGSANGNIIVDDDHTVKRDRRNVIRRIRRAIRKDHIDLHYSAGRYYPVAVPGYAAIDVEQYGRKVGAITPIGICGGCRGFAWHKIEGLDLCDSCAKEVRR